MHVAALAIATRSKTSEDVSSEHLKERLGTTALQS